MLLLTPDQGDLGPPWTAGLFCQMQNTEAILLFECDLNGCQGQGKDTKTLMVHEFPARFTPS